MFRLTVVGLVFMLSSGCESQPANARGPGNGAGEAKAPAQAAAPPADAAPPEASEPGAVAVAEEAGDALGSRFRDPPWFRKTMFGDDATSVNTARSEANEAGLFKSHIVFELPAGTTAEACAQQATDAVAKFVTGLERTEESGGRLKLTGSSDRYNVTMMCGEAKGTMRAYVAYEWTK